MGRPKRETDYIALLKSMGEAGVKYAPLPTDFKEDEIASLECRVKDILGIIEHNNTNSGYMLFFVMYDIENDKVRRYVVKYLEKCGCSRIQKSIFLANLPIEKFNQIKSDLEAVQSVYENNDSILVVPITAEYLKSMKIIGQNIDIDIITHSRNTLFF